MARLDQICSLNMGQSPDSSSYNENGEGMPFFQGNADFGKVHPRVRVWCSAPTKVAHAGDVLISVRAPIGALNIADRECCIGRGLAALTVNEELCNKDYLWYAIASKVDELNSKGTGSTFKAISKSVLAETEIPLPTLAEQQGVARQLAKVDELIGLRKEQITKLDQLVKSRFIELFGEPLTLLESGKTISLEKVFSEITVGFVGEAASSYVKVGIPYLRTQNVRKGYIDFSGLIYVSEEFHGANRKSQIKPGDIVVSRVGVNRGMAAVIPQTLEEANIANCLIIKKEKTVKSEYLAYYLNMSYGLSPKFGASVGSAQGVINTAILKKWEVFLPPYSQQEQFAAFVEQTDKSKLAIQQSLEKLELLKKSLMQEYFW